jgi:hypothetical protein
VDTSGRSCTGVTTRVPVTSGETIVVITSVAVTVGVSKMGRGGDEATLVLTTVVGRVRNVSRAEIKPV